jgi:heme-degrading monooxygenase HmoA
MDMEREMELRLVFEEKMDANHEKMLVNMASFHEKIETRNAESDAHHEKMIASQERTIAKMKDGRKQMAACQEGTEANPDEMKSVTFWSTEEAARGSASSSRATRRAKGTEPGKLWIPEEVGSFLEKDDPPCRSGTAQGKHRQKKNRTRYNVE